MDERVKDKQNPEEYVIAVSDQKDPGKVKIVSGIKNGKPTLVDPKEENEESFLKVKSQSSILENFYENYYRQLKDPTRFQFFKIPIAMWRTGVDLIKTAIKDKVIDSPLFREYRLDTRELIRDFKQSQVTGKKQEVKEEPKPQRRAEKEEDISKNLDREALTKYGISREQLGTSLLSLTLGGKSKKIPVTFEFEGIRINTEAKISLRKGTDGLYKPEIYCYQPKLDVTQTLPGNIVLNNQVRENLINSGHAGEPVYIEVKGKLEPCILTVDKELNLLQWKAVKDINQPNVFRGVNIEKYHAELAQGKKVYIENLTANDGVTKFSTYLRFSAAESKYVYDFEGLKNSAKKRPEDERYKQQVRQSQDEIRNAPTYTQQNNFNRPVKRQPTLH